MAGAACRELHALAIPLPAQGHLNPLMRLSETLAKAAENSSSEELISLCITFLNIDPIHERLQELQSGSQGSNAQPDKGVDKKTVSRCVIRKAHIPIQGLDLSNDFRMSIQHFLESQQSLVPTIDRLISEVHTQPPITSVITDFSMAGPSLSVPNIHRVALFPSSAATLLILTYVLRGILPAKEVLKVVMDSKMDPEEVFKAGLPGLPTLKNGDLPNIKHLEDENLYIYEFLTEKVKDYNDNAQAIVVNSYEELEPDAFAALSAQLKVPVYAVGPLMGSSTSLWKEDEECIEWLDKQPPKSVIYISFGSVALLSPAQFEEILAALLSSKQRFIWVFRPGLIEGSPETAMPDDFLAETREQGRVVKWAPQIRVLSHSSLGAFFSHCGWNSTLEAVTYGVPMLCFPYFYDQFINAKYVEEVWKTGLVFTRKESVGEGGVVGREEVMRLFRAMLEGQQSEAFQKNAIQLSVAGRISIQKGGSTFNNIHAFLKSL